MKVLNLRCGNGHGFEGWFGSEEDFLAQNGEGRIECPLCTDRVISRMPTAPRLNLAKTKELVPTAQSQADQAVAAGPPVEHELQAMWLKAVQHVMKNTEDVGERFVEEARRIHYGEVPERGIRGQATPEQREALQEEGIATMQLPIPAALKGPVQ